MACGLWPVPSQVIETSTRPTTRNTGQSCGIGVRVSQKTCLWLSPGSRCMTSSQICNHNACAADAILEGGYVDLFHFVRDLIHGGFLGLPETRDVPARRWPAVPRPEDEPRPTSSDYLNAIEETVILLVPARNSDSSGHCQKMT